MGQKSPYVSNHATETANIYVMDTNGMNVVKLTRTPPGIDNEMPSWPLGGLAVNPNGKLPISWGGLKRARQPVMMSTGLEDRADD